MNENPLDYYARPGIMTDPREYADMFAGLPTEIGALCKVVQGILLHIFWAERYGVSLTEGQKQTVEVRSVARKLLLVREAGARSLGVALPVEKRQVGNCRDFAVTLTAILRYQGRPARARCGFGTYFLPDHYEDHWVCEYWHSQAQRWILVDPQIDALQREALGIDFDPQDVPHDRFIIAGKAWQMCRFEGVEPEKFGIFDMHGLWFVRGNVFRDFLSLNKVEILPWDGGWGYLTEKAEAAGPEDMGTKLFDHVADLSLQGNEAFAEIRSIYENDELWHIPPGLE